MTVTNLTPPVISGTPRRGQVIQTSPGTWDYDEDTISYEYQWIRCDDEFGSNAAAIPGETNPSYTLRQDDVGFFIESQVTATESSTAPPTPDTLLTWSPPTLFSPGANLVEFTLTNATRNSATLGAGAGRDLVINQTQILTGPIAQLAGWRNIVWIGGELNINTGVDIMALPVRNITGTVHLEGVWIHGTSVADCFVMRSAEAASGMIVQIQNCRFENKNQGGEHPDNTQFQNAKVDAFRIDKCTFYTELQGTFMRVGTSATDYAKNVDFRRLNWRGPGPNRFWQNWENSPNTSELKKIIPVTLTDVWISADGDSRPNVARRVVPDSTFFDGFSSGSRRGAFLDSDVTSDFVYWSDGSQVVPTGASAGQQTLDCGITGIIRDGIPPGGDFVPTPPDGIAYVSPGYA